MVITENDDARGVLQLSSSTYEAEESSQSFVTVSRGAGSFGTVRHATLMLHTLNSSSNSVAYLFLDHHIQSLGVSL